VTWQQNYRLYDNLIRYFFSDELAQSPCATQRARLGTPYDFGRTTWPLREGFAKRTITTSIKIDEPVPARCCVPKTDCLRKGKLMQSGTVKFYNEQKGYGFIAPDSGGKDVFVHATALERAGMHGLAEGQKVSFDTAEDRRTGKIAVNNIQPE
jgi:CspA family cold shock protein